MGQFGDDSEVGVGDALVYHDHDGDQDYCSVVFGTHVGFGGLK
jgi:hypothetical protein